MADPERPATILLIDDDDDLAFALTGLLQGAGYRVRYAVNGSEGLRLAAAEAPDLIILDLLMPVKDGFTAAGELRRLPALRGVPILAFTAFGQDVGEVYGPAGREVLQHVQARLEKPIEPNILLSRVAGLLKTSEQ